MKTIAVFLDGTWNEPDAPDALISKETNVYLLRQSCAESESCIYYDSGVGTQWYDKVIGGVTGSGLAENIKQAYQFLSGCYERGDVVFLFGFSRGAFTARSLAGFLFSCGLPTKVPDNKLDGLFDTYKFGNKDDKERIKRENGTCPIRMIGVWDTVGALGIPHILFDEKITDKHYLFHDTMLSPEVEAGYQALAIDEERHCFEPALWDEAANTVQVWFAGVHGDIGGGYPERHHSDVALKWMMRAAARHGLRLNDDYQFHIDLRQDIHDSYRNFYGFRSSRKACFNEIIAVECCKRKLHVSIIEKVRLGRGYWPLALVNVERGAAPDAEILSRHYSIADD